MNQGGVKVRKDIDDFVKEYLWLEHDYRMFDEDEDEEDYRLCIIDAVLAFIKDSGQFN